MATDHFRAEEHAGRMNTHAKTQEKVTDAAVQLLRKLTSMSAQLTGVTAVLTHITTESQKHGAAAPEREEESRKQELEEREARVGTWKELGLLESGVVVPPFSKEDEQAMLAGWNDTIRTQRIECMVGTD
jgi:hypothetical protein